MRPSDATGRFDGAPGRGRPGRQGGALERRTEIERPPKRELYTVLERMATAPDTRFVLSLGGGAAPGLAGNAALVTLLDELDLRRHVEEVWGTSAGAIVGGAWASGTSAARIRELVSSLRYGRALDVAWPEMLAGLLTKPFGGKLPDAVLRGGRFHRTIRAGLGAATFEECELPFRCIACSDDDRGRPKIFREGDLLRAISASMSLPGLLVPLGDDGTPGPGYYDGGMVEKTPLRSPIADHARSGDPRKLLILGTYYGTEARRIGVARGFIDRFLATIYLLEDRLWDYQQAEARSQDNVDVLLLNPHLKDPSAFDFGRLEIDYLETREAFKDLLQNAKVGFGLGAA